MSPSNALHIVLLRGLGREQRHWGKFPELLHSVLPQATQHMLDLPGIGTEAGRRSPASISGIADDLRARFLKLKESQPGTWVCVSISLGSMIALDWCHRYPDDFAALSIMNTSAANLSPPWLRMRPLTMAKLLRASQCASAVQKERQILDVTTRLSDEEKDLLAGEWAEFSPSRGQLTQMSFAQLGAAIPFRISKSLQLPVQMLIGRRDELCDPRCSRALATHLGAEVAEHPLAGHDLSLDDPLWTSQQIKNFLNKAVASV